MIDWQLRDDRTKLADDHEFETLSHETAVPKTFVSAIEELLAAPFYGSPGIVGASGFMVDIDWSLERKVEREPKPHSWMIVAVGAVVPLGVSAAAAVTTCLTTHERVAMTA